MGTQQQFCLRWNNHQNNMIDVFGSLLSNESFVDVTLACDGATLKAHKMVLSACSSFFQEIFINNPCKHPVIIMKDITLNELKAILEFMYRGEVNVSQDQLSALLKTAESLKVKGLAEVTNEHQAQENQPTNRQTASISTSNSQQMNKNRLIKNSLVRGPPSSIKSPAAKRFRQRRSSGSNSQQNISQEAEHSDFHDNREFVEAPVPHQTEPELSEDAPQKLLPNNAEDVDVKPTICVKDSPVNSPDVEQVDNSQDFVYSSFMDQSLVDEHQNTVEENSRSDGNNTYQDSGEANDEIMPPYDSNMDQSSSIGNISVVRHPIDLNSDILRGLNIRKCKRWTDAELAPAINSVIHGSHNVSQAALEYNIPVMTLWRHVQRRKKGHASAENPDSRRRRF